MGFGWMLVPVVIALLALGAVGVARFRRWLRWIELKHRADWGRRWLNRFDGWIRVWCRRYHGLRADAVHLPRHDGAIVVSNHVSGLDPFLLVAVCRRPLRFIIAREEYERRGLTWFFRAIGCIPVDRAARPERALRGALRQLRAGEVVALFPHGKIHLDSDPRRRLKGGVAALSRLTRCPVIPLRIEGVAGEGQVFPALWQRSRVRMRAFPPMVCEPGEEEAFLRTLAQMIEGHWRAPGPKQVREMAGTP
jgi:1-acyl-sn-glycerol-3-phosphate acyltransferase